VRRYVRECRKGARQRCTALTRLGVGHVVRGGGLAAIQALKGARGGRHERGEARGAQSHAWRGRAQRSCLADGAQGDGDERKEKREAPDRYRHRSSPNGRRGT